MSGTTLTYVDADVLIAAYSGREDLSERALAILEDAGRTFASSIFLRMETAAKASYNKRVHEVAFYDAFFANVSAWAAISDDLIQTAHNECRDFGVNALDALHLAAAASLGADELITAEKHSKSIHRAKLVRVTSIRP